MLHHRKIALSLAFTAVLGAPALAVEELFSKYVQVFQPRGDMAQRLIRASPPPGAGWKDVTAAGGAVRLKVPVAVKVDTEPQESRVLQVILSDLPERPRPILRIDRYTPAPDDPAQVDEDYAAAYAEEYPVRAHGGKFEVTDRGMLVLWKKWKLAMVGGAYQQGAVRAARLQWAYLSKDGQYFVTFDCAEKDLDMHADTVARVLLSLEFSGGKEKRGR